MQSSNAMSPSLASSVSAGMTHNEYVNRTTHIEDESLIADLIAQNTAMAEELEALKRKIAVSNISFNISFKTSHFLFQFL